MIGRLFFPPTVCTARPNQSHFEGLLACECSRIALDISYSPYPLPYSPFSLGFARRRVTLSTNSTLKGSCFVHTYNSLSKNSRFHQSKPRPYHPRLSYKSSFKSAAGAVTASRCQCDLLPAGSIVTGAAKSAWARKSTVTRLDPPRSYSTGPIHRPRTV